MHTQPIEQLTFTSAIGQFTFAPDTLLVHAQRIRDDVTGQWLDPKPNTPRLRTAEDAYKFMRESDSLLLRAVEFKLELNDERTS